MSEARLNQANGRLRSGKTGVVIEAHGDRLYLRATFPPKPSSERSQPYQQRLALGIHNNAAGVSAAEKEARKVGALLDCKQFDWQPYLKNIAPAPETIKDWIERFESDYFERRKRTPATETTWAGDYLKVLRKLPQDQALTVGIIRDLVLTTSPDTKSRKRFAMVATALCNFAGLETDFKSLAGNYSPRRVSPRDLPDDAAIARFFAAITNPGWRWVYGAIATYGLRPHEAFHLDVDQLQSGNVIASVLAGKTGSRRVWPCYPEWYEFFRLKEVRQPNISLNRSNEAIGRSCSHYFRSIQLPFNLYDMRHCWAVRTLEFGLDISLAAQQMGHSVAVHSEQYHAWISDRHHQRAFDTLMMRSDRPKAPTVI